MSVSIVIPIYNERENIGPLYQSLKSVLDELGTGYEILFVDDGSNDGSTRELESLAGQDETVRVLQFRRNFGQAAAMGAGIQASEGDIVITMDGDLQNDPSDIPMLIEKIEEGYDLVHGWRKERHDPFLTRRVPSRIANWLISRVTGFRAHDLGCTLKAMRREIARDIQLYGEMHRFIPILGEWRGARCTEVVTTHHPRRFGTSKYGLSRIFRVLLDLITVKFLIQYLASPMKLFGTFGIVCATVGVLSAGLTVFMKLGQQVDMTGNPLLLLAVFSFMVGIQFFGLGLLGELGARIYYESQNKFPYAIRRTFHSKTSRTSPGSRPPWKRAA